MPGPAVDVGGGELSACALLEDRSVWCWGTARFLGIGLNTEDLIAPTAIIRLR